MIETIHLANKATFDAEGSKLEGLKKLNFIFGSNGSGKTTISRVVEGVTSWVACKISNRSKITRLEENLIQSSYELIWREVRQEQPSHTVIQNVMRRILEHYFKFYGGIKLEGIPERFNGKDKMICNTLLSWVNDGSHFATDDLYMACNPGQVDRYLNVFQRIFEESDHGGHFRMMMGDGYQPLPLSDVEDTSNSPSVAP
ncbi:AAA family ATPase [Candidatus Poribacteria bacterium]|nr:AAA family ATPase [Candidatus Poribacteria bacterium]